MEHCEEDRATNDEIGNASDVLGDTADFGDVSEQI